MISTTDLCDDHFHELSVAEASLKSFGMNKRFSGPITTVKISDNDNDLFMQTIETAEPGSVIVLDGEHEGQCAWMGDRKAGIALKRGIAGIIINGLIRDVEGISKLDMGVLALGTHPCPSRHKAKKNSDGERDVVLNFGNIEWVPGHYVYADEDGVVVSAKRYI